MGTSVELPYRRRSWRGRQQGRDEDEARQQSAAEADQQQTAHAGRARMIRQRQRAERGAGRQCREQDRARRGRSQNRGLPARQFITK